MSLFELREMIESLIPWYVPIVFVGICVVAAFVMAIRK